MTIDVNISDKTVKVICVLASSIIYSSPAHAAHGTPNNILGLADLLAKYAEGHIDLRSAQEVMPEQAQATFG